MFENKFRGLAEKMSVDRGVVHRWVYGEPHMKSKCPHIHDETVGFSICVEPSTVTAYTGLRDPIRLMVESQIKDYHEKSNFITQRLTEICKRCSQKRMILDKETGEMRFVDCSDFCVCFQNTQKELNELYEESMKKLPLNLGEEFLVKEKII